MGIPIEEVFGMELMVPERKGEVVLFLRRLALPSRELRLLYARWARSLGLRVLPEDLNLVAPMPLRGPR